MKHRGVVKEKLPVSEKIYGPAHVGMWRMMRRGGRRGIYFSRRRRRRWPWILLILAITVLIVSALIYFGREPEEAPPMRAAILDGLAADYPNQTFIESAVEVLARAGFEVDVYGPENITLNFLRELPSRDYGLVVFRVHGGRIRQPIGLFIGGGLFVERCGPDSHRDEVESGYLLLGRPFLSNETYCVAPPHYISEKLRGEFRKTIIIAMSCFTGDDNIMASAFFERGAGAYMGFKGEISPGYADAFTITLLRKLYSEKLPIQKAFDQAWRELGSDPQYGGSPALYLP
jgi:hypothetical protein